MEINSFLTETAKKYDPKIKYVGFCTLEERYGVAYLWGTSEFYILLDQDKLPCPHRLLFVFYHEVAHIKLGHLTSRRNVGEIMREAESDDWAYKKMGIFDEEGQVKQEWEICFDCITMKARACLKGLIPRWIKF